ncbi:MAG: hypothetical protein AMDU4_FER2C00238G0032 [Ferroplasma sp. Type II]|nr:MAG: hypothetical protein AMDU4_FER2C00238G0032 [Ferroplasma sp. Type II]
MIYFWYTNFYEQCKEILLCALLVNNLLIMFIYGDAILRQCKKSGLPSAIQQ